MLYPHNANFLEISYMSWNLIINAGDKTKY